MDLKKEFLKRRKMKENSFRFAGAFTVTGALLRLFFENLMGLSIVLAIFAGFFFIIGAIQIRCPSCEKSMGEFYSKAICKECNLHSDAQTARARFMGVKCT